MASQITKDFQMKSKLRKLADGGSPNPNPQMLGTGTAARAGGLLAGRGRQIDGAVDAAVGAPAPAPAPQQAPVTPKKSGLRAMFGLADGGSYLDDDYNTKRYQQSQLRDGGRVEGPGGRTDDKVGPVMLSDEEYVLPGDTADAIGRDKLDAIRLATHDFKDERKESALRGRADDVPVDHLADGGAWIADDKGNVRPNSFGDAAAGPGYQQPRLPPPQPGTAVGPARVPPMGQRPPINMGMVDEVPRQQLRPPTSAAPPWSGPPPTNPNVGPNGSAEAKAFYKASADSAAQAASEVAKAPNTTKDLLKSALRPTNSALLKGSAAIGAGLAAKDMYDNGVSLTNSGDMLASGASLFGPVGAAAAGSWGVGRAIGGFLSEDTNDMIGGVFNQGVKNVGNLFGQDWGADDSALLQQKAEARLNAPTSAAPDATKKSPSPSPSPTSALRSDQGPAQMVTPGSYQSRRLSEAGVPLDVQNSSPLSGDLSGPKTGGFSPVTQGRLATQGTDQYQNLGTYGGNANIYGKADNPARPGRINNFVGVGAGASPANEANGSGSGSGAYGAIQSALRNAGSGTAAPRSSGPTMSVIGGDDAWYEKARKDILSSGVSQGYMNDQLVQLANIRAGRDNNRDTNAQSGVNAQLTADTSRANAELNASVQMADALSRMEQNRATISSQAQAAQLKALQDARARSEKLMEDNVKVFESVADTFAAGDKDKQSQYRELLSTLPPEIHATAQGLAPEDKRAFYTNIIRQQLGRSEGLILGRDAGATAQNAAIGGLIGRMTRFGNGAGGKAVDSALGKIPRIGPALSALRPAENLARLGTLIGAAGGAYATPEVEDLTRWDPVARDPETGAALPARKDIREAATYGAFDTYLNPFDDSVQTVSGRRTNKPTPDEEEAARRFRSAPRN